MRAGCSAYRYDERGRVLRRERTDGRLTTCQYEQPHLTGIRHPALLKTRGGAGGVELHRPQVAAIQDWPGSHRSAVTPPMLGIRNETAPSYLHDLQYDEYGQRTRVDYANGVTERYRYDPRRRWLSHKLTTGPNGHAQTLLGQNSTPPAPSTRTLQALQYHFDPLGNIDTLRNDASALTETQQSLGQPLLGPVVQHFEYDDWSRLVEARGQLQTQAPPAPATDSYQQSFRYSPLHRLQEQRLSHSPAGAAPVQTLNVAIAPSGQTQSQGYRYPSYRQHAPGQIGNVFYHYDAVGNRTHWGTNQSAPDTHAVWDEEQRLQRLSTGILSPATAPPRDRHYLTQPNAKGQAHEAGGQTSTADRPPLGCTASADSLNPTAGNYCAPDSSETRAQYQYDATGERKTKRTTQNAGYDTLYVNPWLTVQVQQNRAASAGNEALARQQEKRSEYVLEGDTRFLAKLNLPTKSCAQRIDPTLNPLSQDSDHTRFHTHSDHLGSINVLTDHCGDVIEHTEQLPYGLNWKQDNSTDLNSNSHATAAGQNNAAQEYGFTGKPEDAESNLIYYGARYYDPRAAVWLSPDPIWEDYFDGQPNQGFYDPRNLSLYSQSFNNPVTYKDPDGNAVVAAEVVFVSGGVLAGGCAAIESCGQEIGKKLNQLATNPWAKPLVWMAIIGSMVSHNESASDESNKNGSTPTVSVSPPVAATTPPPPDDENKK